MYQERYHKEPISSFIGQFGLTEYHELLCPIPPLLDPSKGRPVVRFQGNAMEDGIILAISFNHNVFDVVGVGHVLRSLAACCDAASNGNNPPTALPLQVDKDLAVRQRILGYGVDALGMNSMCVSSFPSYIGSIASDELQNAVSRNRTRLYTFSPDKLATIKSICSSLLSLRQGPESASTHFISPSDVLNSALAICIQRSRKNGQCQLSALQKPAKLSFEVNLRPILELPSTERYFGNLITMFTISPLLSDNYPAADSTEYQGFDLFHITKLAIHIRETLSAIDQVYVRQLGTYLAENQDSITLNFADVSFINHRFLDLYDLNFGGILGKVEHLRIQYGLVDGMCVVMPERRRGPLAQSDDHKRSAPWEVLITSTPAVLEILEKDQLFSFLMSEEQPVSSRWPPIISARL
jgi:fumigaclavine B O-acetyltransferase